LARPTKIFSDENIRWPGQLIFSIAKIFVDTIQLKFSDAKICVNHPTGISNVEIVCRTPPTPTCRPRQSKPRTWKYSLPGLSVSQTSKRKPGLIGQLKFRFSISGPTQGVLGRQNRNSDRRAPNLPRENKSELKLNAKFHKRK
jgi:hypothetical protein